MEIVGLSIMILFLYLYLHEHRRRIAIEKELSYISDKLIEIVSDEKNGLIMLPTANESTKKVVTGINRILELTFQKKREYYILKKEMMEVLTNISHDLRTPLTTLKGYIEILKMKETENYDSEKYSIISKLNQKIDGTIRIVNQFFSVARLESGDMILELKRVNICELSGKIMLEYYELLKKYNFDVNIQIPEKPIWCKMDEVAFGRIIKNLIDNAIKYGRKGCYLGIGVSEDDSNIIISIEDHGQGIPASDIHHIFDRSYALANGEQHGCMGSGLGLFISKKLAQQMDSDIYVYSEPDVKTKFEFIIRKS